MTPQPPQLPLSVCVLISQPFVGSLSQLAKPVPHAVIAQALAVHALVALESAHACPQTPQFDESVAVFTQVLPQRVRPAPQVHVPPTQVCVPTHARPQAPQFAMSVLRFASQPSDAAALQFAKPVRHPMTTQPPALQPLLDACASAQVVPHEPQFAGSLAVAAQYCAEPVPQVARGDAQVVVQWPLEHTWPAGHEVPHAPQLPLSVLVFTSQPLAPLPSQFAKPTEHAPRAQLPPMQVDAALGSAQRWPQVPQFASSAWRFDSQPFAAVPSQSPKDALHTCTVQAPLAQPFAATFGSAQAVPHAPQFDGSMEVFAQNCAEPVPQVASGDAQVVRHMPPEHTWPAPQVVPHAPQFALSVCVFTSQPSAAMALQSA